MNIVYSFCIYTHIKKYMRMENFIWSDLEVEIEYWMRMLAACFVVLSVMCCTLWALYFPFIWVYFVCENRSLFFFSWRSFESLMKSSGENPKDPKNSIEKSEFIFYGISFSSCLIFHLFDRYVALAGWMASLLGLLMCAHHHHYSFSELFSPIYCIFPTKYWCIDFQLLQSYQLPWSPK